MHGFLYLNQSGRTSGQWLNIGVMWFPLKIDPGLLSLRQPGQVESGVAVCA